MSSLPRATDADALFAIDDRPAQEMDMPEWGCSIVIRELDARTMALISRSTSNSRGDVDTDEFTARCVFEGIVEPKLDSRHLELLKGRNHKAYMRIYQAVAGKKKEPSTT